MLNVVYVERNQCLKLRRLREIGDRVEGYYVQFSLCLDGCHNSSRFSNFPDFLDLCSSIT